MRWTTTSRCKQESSFMSNSSNLRLVSLTGADDRTDIADLVRLSSLYPFVEWALLYVPHPGGPRNPTPVWREQFFDTPMDGSNAVHLCFKQPFEELLAGTLPADVQRAKRLQLNINARGIDFTDEQVFEVYKRALDLGPDVILQYQTATVAVAERFITSLAPADAKRVHILLDESRGTGKTPDSWALPSTLEGLYCGFAGGLGPENAAQVLAKVEALGQPYWIDMETKVRTDNQFDLAKCELVLQAAASHMARVISA
jgi:hypothetical protein